MASRNNFSIFPHFLLCILFISLNTRRSVTTDTISLNQTLFEDKIITSKNGNFELGFWSGYVGIRHRYMYTSPLWVGNRDSPLRLPFLCELKISTDGNLVITDESEIQVWSTNLSFIASNSTVAVLLDTGNLVLRDSSDTSKVFWQSCDEPTDTWFPGCYLGVNKVTGENRRLISWKNNYDPSPGSFSLEIEGSLFSIKFNNSDQYWASGNWTGGVFASALDFNQHAKFEFISNASVNYFTYSLNDNQTFVVFTLDYYGQIKQMLLNDNPSQLSQHPTSPYQCNLHAFCGPFGICWQSDLPECFCAEGFSYSYSESGGCVRDVPLQCGICDVFLKLNYTRVYDLVHSVVTDSANNCELACQSDCSCTAYSYSNNCSLWFGDLLHLQTLYPHENNYPLYLRTSTTELKDSSKKNRVLSWEILGAILSLIACIFVILFMICRCRRRNVMRKMKMFAIGTLVPFSYSEMKQMTNQFSERLGGGGFGSVFKGMLPDSTVIAVKKLEHILQGEKQFRSEVSTIGVIQHVNLVRLHGFCSEGDKKLLVYEYMPNGSLDSHLFRSTSMVLDWKTRYQIALGTARGLSYLHDECRDCIIHCDIKPENILLDSSFVPKVGDFGLAKPVARDFSSALTTMRGTIGYLAPEWISGMSITAKADVYSFGMMLLEIISGRRNTEILDMAHFFPVLAANKIAEGDVLSLLDPRLEGNANMEELDRACRVACWCIQDSEESRLSMGLVIQILEGIIEVSIPPVPRLLQVLAENIESIIYFSDVKTEFADEENV